MEATSTTSAPPLKRKRGRPRKNPLPVAGGSPAASAPPAAPQTTTPTTPEEPKVKRARRSKKSKDSEYLYFDDTDTEEDGTKKADTTEKDHSFSGSDTDEASRPTSPVSSTTTPATPPAPSTLATNTSEPVSTTLTGVTKESNTPSTTSTSHYRCTQCHAHNALKSCPRINCSWCCKHAEGGPCAAHAKGKTKKDIPPPPPAPKPAPKRKRGRPRKNPLPASAQASLPVLTPPTSAPTPSVASSLTSPVIESAIDSAPHVPLGPLSPTTNLAEMAAAPISTQTQTSTGVDSEKQDKGESYEQDEGETRRKAMLKPEYEEEFYWLYKKLQRISIREARRLNQLEARIAAFLAEDESAPLEAIVHGTLYRKVPQHVFLSTEEELTTRETDRIENEDEKSDQEGKPKSENDSLNISGTKELAAMHTDIMDKDNAQDAHSEKKTPPTQQAGELYWVDEEGWPLIEDVFIGTDLAAYWEAWKEEFKRRETEEITDSYLVRGSATSAESASASGMPDSSPFIKRRARSLRGFRGDDFDSWNGNRLGHSISASFDSINDLENDRNFISRSASSAMLSVSFDADTLGGGFASSDSGGGSKFMSRYAAKLSQRYPALAHRTTSTSYRDKRQLMRDIATLDPDHIPGLLKIVFRQMPDCLEASQMMTTQRLDMDVSYMSPATLSRVEDYVYTILGKRHGYRRPTPLHASTGSLGRPRSPPLTPYFDHRRRTSSESFRREDDEDLFIRHNDDNDDEDVDIDTTDLNQNTTSRGRGRPRRDSNTNGAPASSKNSKNGSKVRKTERSSSPRAEEDRARNGSSPASAPTIVVTENETVDITSLATSPLGSRQSSEGDPSADKRDRAQRQQKSNGGNIISNTAIRKSLPDRSLLPPKQPKQASPTERPRRTRKVRMFMRSYDSNDKSTYTLSKPLQACLEILQELMDHEFGWVFNTPVDPILLNIPDYFDVIKNPMDLGTIKMQLQSGHYETPEEFAEDVRLVWNNALTYNSEDNDVHTLAKEFRESFEKAYVQVQADWDKNKEKYLSEASPNKRNRSSSSKSSKQKEKSPSDKQTNAVSDAQHDQTEEADGETEAEEEDEGQNEANGNRDAATGSDV